MFIKRVKVLLLSVLAISFASIGYAKDYRLSSQSSYTGKLRNTAYVKERPYINAKSIAILRPGDLISVVTQSKDFYGIKVKQKPKKTLWVSKGAVALQKQQSQAVSSSYSSSSLRSSSGRSYSQNKNRNESSNEALSNKQNRNSYLLGIAHFKNIKKFASDQTGVFVLYERNYKKYSLSLAGDVLFNNLFKSYSLSPGIRYHHKAINEYQLSSAIYFGYEKLFDNDRSFNSIIAHLDLLQIRYQFNQQFSFNLSPLQVRTMLSADQEIPVNFRYGINVGVKF